MVIFSNNKIDLIETDILIDKESVKNILISRTDRLGDVILSLPLVTSVKNVFPDSKVYFLGKKYVEDLIRDYEGIEEFIAVDRRGNSGNSVTFNDNIKLIKDKKIDLVINVKPEFDLAMMFCLAGVKYRIGTGYRWYSFLYNYKVYEHRKVSDKHESDYNINLLRNFFPETGNEKIFHFRYSEDEKNKFREKILNFNIDPENGYIIIHPGSGGSAKDLPAGKFSEVTELLLDKYPDHRVVFTGLKSETELIKNIINGTKEICHNRITDLSGKLDLRELLILIDNSHLFLANSTGPIHIAGALNKNIIGFYPNEDVMSSTRWKPLGDNSIIINPSKENNMNSIDMNIVLKKAEKFL